MARVRWISQTADGEAIHIDGAAMGAVLDAWNDWATAAAQAEAAALFESAVLDQYGSAASAEFTDMRALDISY